LGVRGTKLQGSGKDDNEELNDLYPSPKIIRVIKPRRMAGTGHVSCMGDKRGAYRVFGGGET
jgi:hypothetical protein